jgi:hypothetical protein
VGKRTVGERSKEEDKKVGAGRNKEGNGARKGRRRKKM